jgi:dihydrofolate reductase
VITLIAAIGRNNELGLGNKLLWNISEDMKHFKSYTMGKVIIMGSNTLASIGKPLPGRKCIVLSSKGAAGLAIPAHSIEDILSIEHCYPELVVIGGASVYRQTINLADKLVITHIDAETEADVFFPEIDLTIWKINSTIDGSNETYRYKFVEYVRNESIGDPKRETSRIYMDC